MTQTLSTEERIEAALKQALGAFHLGRLEVAKKHTAEALERLMEATRPPNPYSDSRLRPGLNSLKGADHE